MADEDKTETPKQVAFHYLKSNLFRVVHADGFVGGITPRGLIHFVTYSERAAIPQIVINEVDAQTGGVVGKEIQQIGREGIVREMEVDTMIDLATARSLRDWLTTRVDELEALRQRMEEMKK
jgi:hypothetical protein